MNDTMFTPKEVAVLMIATSMLISEVNQEVPALTAVLKKIEEKCHMYFHADLSRAEGMAELCDMFPEHLLVDPDFKEAAEILRLLAQLDKRVKNLTKESAVCDLCNGEGLCSNFTGQVTCPRCGGKGTLNRKETFN